MQNPAGLVTHADQLPIQSFDWGTLQWFGNSELFPGSSQTLGLSQLRPGMSNPPHYHPNCEELLHVLQGSGAHLLCDQWFEVKSGTTVRIPAGMKHQLVNRGNETLICVIVFSSGDRQTVFLE